MPVVKTIKIQDLAKEIGGRAARKTIEEQKRSVARGLVRSLPDLIRASPVDTGLYAQSWDVELGDLEMAIGNFAPHAPIIEFGARPFKPPIGPLLAWAKRVLQDPSQPPDFSPEVWQLAIGTQRKIEREGIKPKAVLRQQIPEILRNIRKELLSGS